jgi:hypothetical protein
MRLRALDWCSTVPQELQDARPEIKALLKAPGLLLREKVDTIAQALAPVEGRNPRTVDLRFVREEIVSATEANACAWRKKLTPRYTETTPARCAIHLSPARDGRFSGIVVFDRKRIHSAEFPLSAVLGAAPEIGEDVG